MTRQDKILGPAGRFCPVEFRSNGSPGRALSLSRREALAVLGLAPVTLGALAGNRWLLAAGRWNDGGRWDDSAAWRD